jgi:hypothetical protein
LNIGRLDQHRLQIENIQTVTQLGNRKRLGDARQVTFVLGIDQPLFGFPQLPEDAILASIAPQLSQIAATKPAALLLSLSDAAPLLDRLTHHAHIVELLGESYRFRQRMTEK